MRAHAVRLASLAAPSLLALVLHRAAATTTTAATSIPTRSTRSSRPSWAPAGCSTPEDVAQPSNATRTVDCAEKHTAETFAVGELPEELRGRRLRRTRSSGPSPTRPAREVPEVPRRRREHGDAHHRQLGVVPALGEGVGQGRPLVPLRHRRRRRREQGVRRRCPTTAAGLLGAAAAGRRWMACVDGPSVHGRAEGAVHRAAHLARGDDDQGRRPERPLPRRPAGRGDDPRLLLRLGRAAGSATRRSTTSATRGSTRASGRPATAGRSAGRRPTA